MKFKVLFLSAAVMCLGLSGCQSTNGLHATRAGARTGTSQTYAQDSRSGYREIRKCRVTNPAGGHGQHYFFAFDSNRINSRFRNSIRNQASYLMRHPGAKIRLEGNADDRGSREYNIALGWRRARAVARLLKAEGVSKRDIVLISYGAERPVVFKHSERARQCNRRVDLIWVSK